MHIYETGVEEIMRLEISHNTPKIGNKTQEEREHEKGIIY
jgi:hypothetical protein